ncbi:MAG: CocE/NonD family hydrolase [Clostridiales bacterium]|nr:CocE/NonD family hydrolase [Clostridiales bacterium]
MALGEQANIIIERAVMVPVRDGTKLRVDIYRPVDDEKHGVVMSAQGYDKDFFWQQHQHVMSPLVAAQKGFVAIVAEDRGRYGSEGVFEPYKNAGKDTYDLVEWAAVQPWSNGNVGLYGPCYNCTDGYMAALEQPPHLKAVFGNVSNPNCYKGWCYQNGVMVLSFMYTWSVMLNATDLNDASEGKKTSKSGSGKDVEGMLVMNVAHEAHRPPIPQDQWERAPWTLPLKDDKYLVGAHWWPEWLEHPMFDDYWKPYDSIGQAYKYKCATFIGSCWYDPTQLSHIRTFQAIQQNSDPSVRKDHRLLIGPWDHHAYMNTRPGCAGVRNFKTETGQMLMGPLCIKFMKKHLLGEGDGIFSDEKPVRYFRMGENKWIDVPSWPPVSENTNFYIHSGGNANTDAGDGTLNAKLPGQEARDTYTYDPKDPVMSYGGHSQMLTEGIHDHAEKFKGRQDILVYDTEVLEEDLLAEGAVSATIYAITSAEDTDFFVQLIDIEPDGFNCPVTQGIIRARFHNGYDHEDFITPGEIVKYEIECFDIAWLFQKGHRIRFAITSSEFPSYTRNLNSRVSPELGTEEDIVVANQQILHCEEYPSYITLPVVK